MISLTLSRWAAVIVGPMSWKIHQGDCRIILGAMDDSSIDAIVTDPPYEIGFMGKKWDSSGITYDPAVWEEALRVLKPGGYLLAFGGTRTYHRLACAVEDAGFEIRDSIHWIYGSGFPKSRDISKAIDREAGLLPPESIRFNVAGYTHNEKMLPTAPSSGYVKPIPATEAAKQWEGWGTGLKPAHEPIVLARKPFPGTVAANVQRHGTGALNVGGCRVGDSGGGTHCKNRDRDGQCLGHNNAGRSTSGETIHGLDSTGGRWPPNLCLSPEAAEEMDRQSGELHGGREANTGGASRFFPIFKYQPKASQRERHAGLPKEVRNIHPTVKPVILMQWLCRLITPPGGMVLDPFAGSGSTGIAAIREGFDFIGIELELKDADIATRRIKAWTRFL